MTEPNVMWIKARSWHIANTLSHATDGTYTLCGRKLTGPMEENRVSSEKTCESCLRRYAAHHEPRGSDDSPNP